MQSSGHIKSCYKWVVSSTPVFVQQSHISAYDVVVIGGSAGGIPALIEIMKALPRELPLPILVVQHLPASMPSRLPEVLAYHSGIPVKWALHDEPLLPGVVHIAPAGRHLVLAPGLRTELHDTAKVGWWRPAVDLLFTSAARVTAERTIAVILSGAMWDGAKGIAAVAAAGGITIVQDEPSSGHFDMPAAAIDFGRADVFLPPKKIAEAIGVLAGLSSTSEGQSR